MVDSWRIHGVLQKMEDSTEPTLSYISHFSFYSEDGSGVNQGGELQTVKNTRNMDCSSNGGFGLVKDSCGGPLQIFSMVFPPSSTLQDADVAFYKQRVALLEKGSSVVPVRYPHLSTAQVTTQVLPSLPPNAL